MVAVLEIDQEIRGQFKDGLLGKLHRYNASGPYLTYKGVNMKLKILRKGLQIIPDGDERDVVYIEEVLGLKKDGDSINLVRRNAHRLSCLAYLETVKE